MPTHQNHSEFANQLLRLFQDRQGCLLPLDGTIVGPLLFTLVLGVFIAPQKKGATMSANMHADELVIEDLDDSFVFSAEILPDGNVNAWGCLGTASTFGTLSASTKSSVGTVGTFS
jgi:hypothetical protein